MNSNTLLFKKNVLLNQYIFVSTTQSKILRNVIINKISIPSFNQLFLTEQLHIVTMLA